MRCLTRCRQREQVKWMPPSPHQPHLVHPGLLQDKAALLVALAGHRRLDIAPAEAVVAAAAVGVLDGVEAGEQHPVLGGAEAHVDDVSHQVGASMATRERLACRAAHRAPGGVLAGLTQREGEPGEQPWRRRRPRRCSAFGRSRRRRLCARGCVSCCALAAGRGTAGPASQPGAVRKTEVPLAPHLGQPSSTSSGPLFSSSSFFTAERLPKRRRNIAAAAKSGWAAESGRVTPGRLPLGQAAAWGA